MERKNILEDSNGEKVFRWTVTVILLSLPLMFGIICILFGGK